MWRTVRELIVPVSWLSCAAHRQHWHVSFLEHCSRHGRESVITWRQRQVLPSNELTSWPTARHRRLGRSLALSVLRLRSETAISTRRWRAWQRGGRSVGGAWRGFAVERSSRTWWRCWVPVWRPPSPSCSPSASTDCTTACAPSNCTAPFNPFAGPTTLTVPCWTRYVSISSIANAFSAQF